MTIQKTATTGVGMATEAFVALLCVLVPVSCTKSADVSTDDLSAALLDITDMPGDWRETQRDVFTERANENPSIDPSVWCPAAATQAQDLVDLAGESGADVEMQMQGTQGSARLMRLQAWSNENTRDYFELAVAAVNICEAAKWSDEGGATQEMWKVDGPDVGDESVSWANCVAAPTGTDKYDSTGHTTVARFGDVVMVLQIGDFSPGGASECLADQEWREIVEIAADKIDDA